jgi:hypothetical protein
MLDRVKAYTPINFELAGNPVNWVIVFLMVLFAGLALSLVFHPLDQTGD